MKIEKIFLCQVCNYSSIENGKCPYCETALVLLGREEQAEYQEYPQIQNAMRSMSEHRWYI